MFWRHNVTLVLLYVESFFFSSRRRHTRLQGDWSSDVCSSDLVREHDGLSSSETETIETDRALAAYGQGNKAVDVRSDCSVLRNCGAGPAGSDQIGRGAGRGRGEISVVGVLFKKKKKIKRLSMT